VTIVRIVAVEVDMDGPFLVGKGGGGVEFM
jgi:hypothetical protein